MMRTRRDRISELPSVILHKIQGCLPLIDSARTSVLSKHWNSIWISNPKFEFEQISYMKHINKFTPSYRERVKDFFSFVDTSLRTFAETGVMFSSVLLHLKGIQADSIPLINTWLPLSLSNGASQLDFEAFVETRAYIAYPLSETAFSVNSNAKFFNLQTLILREVIMSERNIRDITQNCPNIVKLTLFRICILKSIEISNLHKIESLRLSLMQDNKKIFVDTPSLKNFFCISHVPNARDVISCPALKSLTLRASRMTDDEVSLLIMRLQCLETLRLIFCQVLEIVKISHPRLKSLLIYDCREIEYIFIDAPSLSKFTYEATIVKFPLLSSNAFHGNVDLIYKLDVPTRIVLDTSKFVELRRFLGNLTRVTYLAISFSSNEVSFDLQSVEEYESLAMVEVDHLDLNCVKYMDKSGCAALLEGLLWICHPRVISITIDDDMENSLQKVFFEKLCEWWHHGLKAAKIDFNGERSLHDKSDGFELTRWSPSMNPLAVAQKKLRVVRFLLEWDTVKIKPLLN